MFDLTVVPNLPRKEWAEFVNHHPEGNIFQSPDMYDLFNTINRYEPIFVGVVDKNREVVGILLAVIQKEFRGLMGYFTARTIVYGGPLLKEGSNGQQQMILERILDSLLKKTASKSLYIQFRNLFDLNFFLPQFKSRGFAFFNHLNYRVETKDNKSVKKKISNSKLRQIKKSINAGARIIEPQSMEQVKHFYEILKKLYKKKVRKPLPRWSFFKRFYELSKKKEIGKYFLIDYKNKIVGGIMCPITPDRVIYEWYIGSSDSHNEGIYPGVLATWAPIDYALQNGLEYFDFMGAGKPGQDYGVRDFKSKFGGELVDFGRFERINNGFLYKLGKLGLKIKSIKK